MTVNGLHQDIIKRAKFDQDEGKTKHLLTDLQGSVDLFDQKSFEVCLVPLNPLPVVIALEDWGSYIGFNTRPQSFLDDILPAGQRNYKSLALMSIVDVRSGTRLESIPRPTWKHPPYYQIAHGSYLDFKACPIALQPDWALKWFLYVRTLCPKGKVQRATLVRLVQDVIALEQRCPGATASPQQYTRLKLNSVSYQVSESLKPRNEDEGLVWCSDPKQVATKIRDLQQISDDVVDEFFGPRRNGVRHRACCRL